MANMYDKVVGVISKPSHLRNDFETQPLLPWLRKKSELFSKLKTDFLKDIVRNCQLKKYDHNDIIIKQGDQGDCFFIILGGVVSIYMLNKEWDSKDAEKRSMGCIGDEKADGSLDRSKLGKFVCHLEFYRLLNNIQFATEDFKNQTGVPFGEVALLSSDCIRTASIIAEQPTDIMVVDRELYNRAVRDVLAHEFQEKTAFIRDNPVFRTWSPKYAKMLAMAMFKESFQYGDVLMRQGDQVNNIYFVIRGQVQIQIDPSQYRRQFLGTYNADDDVQSVFKDKLKHGPKHRQRCTKHKVVNALCLGINESIGETEFLMDLESSIQTAICTEKTDILVLERKHYDRLLIKRHPKSIELMRQILERKIDARMVLMNNKDVDFIRFLKKKLHSMNNPVQVLKIQSELSSLEIAEREFRNHKGPLIDMFGPGSVFNVIKLREKSKLRMVSKAVRPTQKQDFTTEVLHKFGTPLSQVDLKNVKMSDSNQEIANIEHQNAKSLEFSKTVLTISKKEKSEYYHDTNDERLDRYNENDLDTFSDDCSEDYISDFENINNDAELTVLEARVQEWLFKDNPRRNPHISQMRRVCMDDIDAIPKAGNIVVMRPRKTFINENLVIKEEDVISVTAENLAKHVALEHP